MKHFLFLAFFICLCESIYSQVDFSASETEGCGTLDVDFTNESVPTGTTFFWNFGDGQTSTLENPSIIYTTPGTYTVSLTVDGSLTETKMDYITVYTKPVPDFSAGSALSGCAPLSVNLLGNGGGSTIITWYWDFGDGNTSSQQNPTHNYDVQNTLTVTLVVVDDNTCQGSVSKINYVTVYKPEANFDADNKFACEGDITANFTNLSSALGVSPVYLWDFGDGTTSTQTNPTHLYTENGHYTVKLSVTDENSCINTKEVNDFIILESVEADFTLGADTICPTTSYTFTNLSLNANNYFWDFGDSTASTAKNPKHTFVETGDYTVSLRVSNSGSCFDTYVKTINVQKVIADFTLSSYFSCVSPVTINYKNKSHNGYSWDWRFGNKTFSTGFEPSVIFGDEGTFVDTLIVTSMFGCMDTLISDSSLVIEVPKAYCTPNAFIRPNDAKGCIPLTVNFKDETSYATSSDYIEKWSWNFGDGTSSTSKNPTHQYTTINSFSVSLEITTKHGCKSSTGAMIRTGDIQKANFTKDAPDTICASRKVQFTDLSDDPNLVNEWYWKFGDGTTSTKQNPLHGFKDVGSMDVTLLAYHNGCPSKVEKKDYIYVKGPYNEINYSINCETPYNAIFSSKILEASSYSWNFADGSPLNSSEQNPVHTYSFRGIYLVKLHSENPSNGCDYDVEKEVAITDIKANFTNDKNIGCVNLAVNLNSGTSVDAVPFDYNNVKRKYLWNFGDNTAILQTNDIAISHTFKKRGDFPVKLTVRDVHGCENSLVRYIKAYKPLVDFDASLFSGCKPMTVDFTNNTISDTTITEWLWSFGDGNTSVIMNPTNIYEEFGVYNVSLKARNLIGCETILEKKNYIEALRPSPDFSSNDQTICIGTEVGFNAYTNENIVSYLWNFGDGNTSTLANPKHTYISDGDYNVSLSLVDDVGCDSSSTIYNYINVQSPPTVDFVGDDLFTNCFPLIVNFSDRTSHPDLSSWYWDFGDGAISAIKNPLHIYNRPGDFTVSLTAKTTNGCAGSLDRVGYVHVGGPYADIIAEDTICKNAATTLIAANLLNVNDIKWFFPNGVTVENDTAIYSYDTVGMVYPILLLTVDDAQTCDKYFQDSIYITELIAKISNIDDEFAGCQPVSLYFNSESNIATSWSWDFGTGETSDSEGSYYSFPESGVYNVTLIVSNELGCLDTTSAKITVHPIPELITSPDTLVCYGDSAFLSVSGAELYNWFPNYGLDNNLLSNPVAMPYQTTTYSVEAIDTNNCYNYASVMVKVQQEPIVNIPDTIIIIGEKVILDATSNDISYYNWSSSYDISCLDCSLIEVQPLEKTVFNLTYSDTSNCFTKSHSILIDVIEAYTVDLPKAFTPNGDGINDIVYIRGWGIKELLDFKVFNRYGELVFKSSDINTGWDGSNEGKSQNIETFTYLVRVKTYDDNILTKTGTIKLLK